MGNKIGFGSGFEGEKYKGKRFFFLFPPLNILQVATISMVHELR